MPVNNTATGRLQNQKIVEFLDLAPIRGGVTRGDIPNCLNRFWIREGFRGKIGPKKITMIPSRLMLRLGARLGWDSKCMKPISFMFQYPHPPYSVLGTRIFFLMFVKPNLLPRREKLFLETLRTKKIYSYFISWQGLSFSKLYFFNTQNIFECCICSHRYI